MGDMDIGEIILNFILHESMQALCGVDLTEFFGKKDKSTGRNILLWEKWVRAAMGLKSSPYQAVQGILVAKEVILGDRTDSGNVFRWDDVRMNLPGASDYDPALPWVSKIRLEDGNIAADLFIYEMTYGLLETQPNNVTRLQDEQLALLMIWKFKMFHEREGLGNRRLELGLVQWWRPAEKECM
jgi:hypothetical protein